jgi:hypothetical protein
MLSDRFLCKSFCFPISVILLMPLHYTVRSVMGLTILPRIWSLFGMPALKVHPGFMLCLVSPYKCGQFYKPDPKQQINQRSGLRGFPTVLVELCVQTRQQSATSPHLNSALHWNQNKEIQLSSFFSCTFTVSQNSFFAIRNM